MWACLSFLNCEYLYVNKCQKAFMGTQAHQERGSHSKNIEQCNESNFHELRKNFQFAKNGPNFTKCLQWRLNVESSDEWEFENFSPKLLAHLHLFIMNQKGFTQKKRIPIFQIKKKSSRENHIHWRILNRATPTGVARIFSGGGDSFRNFSKKFLKKIAENALF